MVVLLLGWAALNTRILTKTTFDPYSYLIFESLAIDAGGDPGADHHDGPALAAEDREMATYDYEVNPKTAMDVMARYEKMDIMRPEYSVPLVGYWQTPAEGSMRLLERSERQRGLRRRQPQPKTGAPR